jgi:hypothetical protein
MFQASFGLNEHHDSVVVNYLRFARFVRQQCLKRINNSFQGPILQNFLKP